MKNLISTMFLALVTASTAQAQIKIEPRVFHSNLATMLPNSLAKDGSSNKLTESFLNTAGIGVNGLYSLDQNIDLGLGYSFARYSRTTIVQSDLHTISAFGRYNFIKSESSAVYALVGLSNLQFDQNFETQHSGSDYIKGSDSSDALLNADIGIGGSIKVGSLDLGLEYKYSNSLNQGNETIKTTAKTSTGIYTEKLKVKGITAETQELALTLGLSI